MAAASNQPVSVGNLEAIVGEIAGFKMGKTFTIPVSASVSMGGSGDWHQSIDGLTAEDDGAPVGIGPSGIEFLHTGLYMLGLSSMTFKASGGGTICARLHVGGKQVEELRLSAGGSAQSFDYFTAPTGAVRIGDAESGLLYASEGSRVQLTAISDGGSSSRTLTVGGSVKVALV